ncbi:MAG TPA: ribosome silencing factor [Planctomycetota bacterium]|nr:ribosome silencing factor [Planctomycetota bacterium]
MEPKQLAATAAKHAWLKKGDDIRVYQVTDQLRIADYFVLITALNRPHVKAVHQELHVSLKAAGETCAKAEGADVGWWVLMDYLDVVVHILQPEARAYYDLDHLYGECPELDWQSIETPGLPEETERIAE